jgi:hypothetical protein
VGGGRGFVVEVLQYAEAGAGAVHPLEAAGRGEEALVLARVVLSDLSGVTPRLRSCLYRPRPGRALQEVHVQGDRVAAVAERDIPGGGGRLLTSTYMCWPVL